MLNDDCKNLISYINKNVSIEIENIPKTYEFPSIVLCIIDAVYSINSNYTSTRRTVERANVYFNVENHTALKDNLLISEYTIGHFLNDIKDFSYQELAEKVFVNRQRTSPTNGLLKAEAVVRYAQVLAQHKIDTLGDIQKQFSNQAIMKDIKKIPGQLSGISYEYFLMLCGDTSRIKLDRHILNFLLEATGKSFTDEKQVLYLMNNVLDELKKEHKNLNLRLLDHSIWAYMSSRSTDNQSIQTNDLARNSKDNLERIYVQLKELDRNELIEIVKYIIDLIG